MGTPEFAIPALAGVLEAGHEVVAVYCQPPRPAGRGQKETPTPVHKFALEHNLPVYTPLSLKDAETQDIFKHHNADAAIVAAYGLLLPKQILEATKFGCLNIHPSLLPRWRGAAPIQRTIMAGDKETGVAIMQMDAGLDTGDILMEEKFTIPEGVNAGQLHDILAKISVPLLLQVLQDIKIVPHTQQSADGVAYAHKISKDECKIDWHLPANVIRNKILGLAPHPSAFFLYKGEAIKVSDCKLVEGSSQIAGELLDDNLTVACGQGAISILTVQRPSKKPMPALEMLRGYPIKAGEVLE